MPTQPKKSGTASLRWLQPALVVGSAAPLAYLVWLAILGRLGANPIAEVLNQLGFVAIILLLASLACTPLRIIFGWNWPFRTRRTLGLMGFVYAALHVCTYAGLDQVGNWRAIWMDVTQRKFIFVGFAAFLMLIPLALTSTANSVRRIGSKNWKRLHRLAYTAVILGVIHFYLRVKADTTEPILLAIILGLLFAVRMIKSVGNRRRAQITRNAVSHGVAEVPTG